MLYIVDIHTNFKSFQICPKIVFLTKFSYIINISRLILLVFEIDKFYNNMTKLETLLIIIMR